MIRIFVRNDLSEVKEFSPESDDAHYLLQVMRVRVGEELRIVDSKGTVYEAAISAVDKKTCTIALNGIVEGTSEPTTKITLYQSVSKGERMDLTIQKSVELGVTKIVPVMSERCVVKLDGKSGRSDRWQKIALEAARQSGRDIVPLVTEPVKFSEAVKTANEEMKIIPWEEASRITLKGVVSGKKPRNIAVFIGPEGGFTPAEADMARANDITPVTLGKRILRTETAGPAVLAMLLYELEL